MNEQAITESDLIHRMEKRITNLEIALHGMWSLMIDHQAPYLQEQIGNLMRDHYNASIKQGGFRKAAFED